MAVVALEVVLVTVVEVAVIFGAVVGAGVVAVGKTIHICLYVLIDDIIDMRMFIIYLTRIIPDECSKYCSIWQYFTGIQTKNVSFAISECFTVVV